jgi:hypothetical protein
VCSLDVVDSQTYQTTFALVRDPLTNQLDDDRETNLLGCPTCSLDISDHVLDGKSCTVLRQERLGVVFTESATANHDSQR